MCFVHCNVQLISEMHLLLTYLELHVHKDSYHLNTSELDKLRNTFIFMNECLTAENRKLLTLARSESKKNYKYKGYTVNGQVRVKK